MTKSCRNCLSEDVQSATTGLLAPFFLKRVFGIDLISFGSVLEGGRNDLFVDFLRKNRLDQVLSFKSPVLTSVRICKHCGFVGPEMCFSSDLLKGLYKDYRSESYNRDRSNYEPYYARIQNLVGKDVREVETRLGNLDSLLEKNVDIKKLSSILDWGGGEGRFIPRSLVKKEVFILDVSDEPLVNERFTRIECPPPDRMFDYIQVCHVLEHVSSPHEFVKNVVKFLKPGGLLYIEVPQDQSDSNMQLFKSTPNNINHTIHEHLNLYGRDALVALGNRIGLEQIIVQRHQFDLGWTKGVNLCGLFRNPQS
jgi:SAM-dependent methyltransferase